MCQDARIAFEAIMESLDWNSLLKVVDYSYENFRKPGLVAFGTDDKYLELDQVVTIFHTHNTTRMRWSSYHHALLSCILD